MINFKNMIKVKSIDNHSIVLTNGDTYPVPFSFNKSEQLKQNFIESVVEMANRLTIKK